MMGERLLILGTGAMACWFAARLAPHAEVVLAGRWAAGLEALRRRGVVLEQNGARVEHRVGVADYADDLQPFRLALVLVKAYQTEAAAQRLAAWLAADGVAVTLQNGLGNLEILTDALGEERAALGITTAGATLVEPGVVRSGGDGPTRFARHARTPAMVELMRVAGLDAGLSDDAVGLAWGKLVLSAAVNPITALLRIPNGDLLLPRARGAWEVAGQALDEGVAVSRSAGIRLPFDDPRVELERVLDRTVDNHSSMLQDVERGRLTEVETINGAVVRHAQAHAIPVPVNRLLLALVSSLAASAGRGEA
jgi:2-dehydropantoate 2-reductase